MLAGVLKPVAVLGAPASSECPDGRPGVRCLVDPCKDHACGKDEECESNYCGGCNAVCKPKKGAGPVLAAPASTASSKCPKGDEVRCLADPCKTKKCGKDEECESNYCGGCNAVCKPKKGAAHLPTAPAGTSTSKCPKGDEVRCLVDPCKTKKCGKDEECESNYCGGCNAVCKPKTVAGRLPTAPSSTSSSKCPKGDEVRCLVDPCKGKACGKDEECESNYCGGCNAVCKPKKGAAHLPTAPTGTTSSKCPKGDEVRCLVDPCKGKICGKDEECESNYCGGCNAVCKPKKAPAAVSPGAVKAPADSSCPKSKPRVQCKKDPCKDKKCGKGEACVATYCGECKADCVRVPRPMGALKPAPDSAPTSECPSDKPKALCKMSPCAATLCPAGTTCVPDYCGGCFAKCQPADKA
jgi:hypothetical protein